MASQVTQVLIIELVTKIKKIKWIMFNGISAVEANFSFLYFNNFADIYKYSPDLPALIFHDFLPKSRVDQSVFIEKAKAHQLFVLSK